MEGRGTGREAYSSRGDACPDAMHTPHVTCDDAYDARVRACPCGLWGPVSAGCVCGGSRFVVAPHVNARTNDPEVKIFDVGVTGLFSVQCT